MCQGILQLHFQFKRVSEPFQVFFWGLTWLTLAQLDLLSQVTTATGTLFICYFYCQDGHLF